MLLKATLQLQNKKRLPQYVMLADSDNELLINLENSTSVLMLLETVKNREEFILKEFLHDKDSLVHSKEGYYTNQVIVSFFNEKKMKHDSNLKKEAYDAT